jgi:predicted small secreted protein
MSGVFIDAFFNPEETVMKKIVLILIAVGVLAGCNTVAGVGKDVEKAGEVVQDAANKKK